MSDLVPAQDKAKQADPTGLYVHVPFCARTCDYCAFYQGAPSAQAIRQYLAGIAREASLVSWPKSIATVFWGGGTPGLLSAKDLHTLGALVLKHSGGQPAEWSVEMTPLAVTEARLEAFKEIGVNRISLGIQSFNKELLKALGRDHSPEQAYRAYDRLRKAGFDNINFDLMFALPGQSDEDWAADIDEALSLGPDHLSTYCLTFEEDTKLWVKLSQGRLKRDIEAEARLYTWTWENLASRGYAQYEVSNFARPGKTCLHNLNTWRMHSWIGLGPSASSQERLTRGTNIADQEAWLKHLEAGRRGTEDRAELTPASLAEDALIFGLRMNEGVDVAEWKSRAPLADWKSVDTLLSKLEGEQMLVREGTRVKLNLRGRLLADSIGEELLGLLANPA